MAEQTSRGTRTGTTTGLRLHWRIDSEQFREWNVSGTLGILLLTDIAASAGAHEGIMQNEPTRTKLRKQVEQAMAQHEYKIDQAFKHLQEDGASFKDYQSFYHYLRRNEPELFKKRWKRSNVNNANAEDIERGHALDALLKHTIKQIGETAIHILDLEVRKARIKEIVQSVSRLYYIARHGAENPPKRSLPLIDQFHPGTIAECDICGDQDISMGTNADCPDCGLPCSLWLRLRHKKPKSKPVNTLAHSASGESRPKVKRARTRTQKVDGGKTKVRRR